MSVTSLRKITAGPQPSRISPAKARFHRTPRAREDDARRHSCVRCGRPSDLLLYEPDGWFCKRCSDELGRETLSAFSHRYVPHSHGRPTFGSTGTQAFSVETRCNRAVTCAGAAHLLNPTNSDLLGLVWCSVPIATLSSASVAVGVSPDGVTTCGGFRLASVPQTLRDHFAVEFSKHSEDLSDSRSHRVIGVVRVHFTGISREHHAPELPDKAEDSLLHCQSACQTVKTRHHHSSGYTRAQPFDSAREAGTVSNIKSAASAFVPTPVHDLVPVGPGPLSDGSFLSVQAIAIDLSFTADSHVCAKLHVAHHMASEQRCKGFSGNIYRQGSYDAEP